MKERSAHRKAPIPMSALLVRAPGLVCWTFAVLLVPALVLGQTPTAPQQSTVLAAAQGASMVVHVKSPVGASVAAAAVTLLPLPSGAAISQDTDDDGTTVFSALRPGQYRVLITKLGFIEIAQDVRLGANVRQDFEVSLQTNFSDAVTVIGAAVNIENELNGRATLPEIVGTTLYAGKKSDVLVLDQMDANTTSGNQRQVFAKIPGTQIWEHDSSGLQIGISNRGLDPNRSWETNQRMNGYDIMAEVFAYPDTYFSPPLDAVERIEMVRGSASLQYGAQFGGLVNYQIRRAPVDRRFTLSSTQTGGSNGFFSSHNQVGGKVGKVAYNGYYHRRQGDGWRRANNEFDNNTGFGQIEIKVSEKMNVGFEITGLETLIHMGGGLTDAQFQEDSRQSNFPGNWFRVKWIVPSVKLEYSINPSTRLSFTSAFIEGHRSVMWSSAQLATPAGVLVPYDPTTPRAYWDDTFHNSSNELRVARIHNWLGSGSAMVAGFRYYHSNMSRLHGSSAPGAEPTFEWYYPNVDRNLHNKTVNTAFFVENAFRFSEKLTVTPGFRFEHVESTASGRPIVGAREQIRTLPMAGVGATFRATQATTIYGNITQAYRPTLLNDNWQGDSRVVVDPDLKDMTGFVTEYGYRGTLGRSVSFDVGGFYIKYNDRLGRLTTQTSTGPTFYYTNISNSRNIGAELFLEADLLSLATGATSKSQLFVFASMAPISARYMEGPVSGNRVEFSSSFIGRWGGTFKRGLFSGTLQYSRTGDQFTDANNTLLLPDSSQGYIPEQRVMDLTANYGLSQNYVLTLGINNLLDSKYFTRRASAYPGPGLIGADGRTVNLGITVKY
jgi:Fe(3+) dicitrate transport protein